MTLDSLIRLLQDSSRQGHGGREVVIIYDGGYAEARPGKDDTSMYVTDSGDFGIEIQT